MAAIVTRYCDLCSGQTGVIQVTLKAGENQPFEADLCRECLGKIKSSAGNTKRTFHKVRLPPQPT
jgi:hypothetical protein